MDEQHKVLVIACGGRKNSTEAGPMRALDLYAGRQFALARRLEALGWTVLVMSAKHGLIEASHKLHSYDLRMDAKLAARAAANIRRGSIAAHVFRTWADGASRIAFYGGAEYAEVFNALLDAVPPQSYDEDGRRVCEVEQIIGAGCGDHFSVLKAIVAEEEAAQAPAALAA